MRERITALVSRLKAHRCTISWRFISNDIRSKLYVKLSNQHPRSLPFLPTPSEWVTRGFLRASHAVTKDALRSNPHRPYYAHDHPQPLEPDRISHFEIEIWPTSWVFKKGPRIRLELANADSPVFDAPFSHHYGTKIGTDTVCHDAEHPSYLELPVIPRFRSRT